MATRRTAFLFLKARDQASGVIAGVGRNLSLLGGIAATVGGAMLGRALVRGATQAARAMIRVGADFEQGMSNVRAVTRASTDDMIALEKQARQLGKSTVFTAVQAAGAMESFALSGFNVREIVDALPASLNLAAAGQLEMADAARISANILRSFNKQASDLESIVDILAATASNSNQTVSDLGESFKFASTSAASLGVSVNEVAALMAIMADRGLKADLSGTALRRTFAAFLGELDAGAKGLGGFTTEMARTEDGAFSFATAVELMTEAGVSAKDAYTLFGLRAGAAMDILLRQGGETIREYTEIVSQMGVAGQQAGDRIDNLRGDAKLLTSAMAELGIAGSKIVNPALRAIVQSTTAIVGAFASLIAQLEPVGLSFARLGVAFLDFTFAGLILTDALLRIARSFNFIDSPIAKMAAKMGGLSQLLLTTAGRFQDVADKLQQTNMAVDEGIPGLGDYLNALVQGRIRLEEWIAAQEAASGAPPIKPELDLTPFEESIFQLAENLDKLGIRSLDEINQRGELLSETFQLLNQVIDNMPTDRFSAVNEQLKKMADAILKEGGVVDAYVQMGTASTDALLTMDQQVRLLTERGFGELLAAMSKVNTETQSLAANIRSGIGSAGVSAANSLGVALVDAALTGKFAFKQFFQALLRQIAIAIAQAIILRTILAIGGGAGGRNSSGNLQPASGLLVRPSIPGLPGHVPGGLQPPLGVSVSAAVLSDEATAALLDRAAGGDGERRIRVEVESDIPLVIKRITTGVREGRGELEATRLFSGNSGVL